MDNLLGMAVFDSQYDASNDKLDLLFIEPFSLPQLVAQVPTRH
jgi:hypothetical protein